jgi:hypothetical protein
MTYLLPPLNALRAFEAAARHLSFKLAAQELHVTPAAIGQQVKALENRLGVRLSPEVWIAVQYQRRLSETLIFTCNQAVRCKVDDLIRP